MRERRRIYRVLVGKHEGKRLLWRPRHRWEDTMDLQEVENLGVDWIDLAQDRDTWRANLSEIMNIRASQNAGNFLTNSKQVSFARRNVLHGISK
jgi:hypothetical protein